MFTGDEMDGEWGKAKGLFKTLGELNEPDLSYEFHIFWVFQHVETGRLFYASDSGCSCPSPFERETWETADKNSFAEITPTNLDEFVKQMWSFCENESTLQDEKRELERQVKEIINAMQ